MAQIFGNTFQVREQLKQLGGRWNPLRRCWDVAEDRADEARRIVAEGPTAKVQLKPAAAVAISRPPTPELPTEPVYEPSPPCHVCGWQKCGPICRHCKFTTEILYDDRNIDPTGMDNPPGELYDQSTPV